MYDKIQEFINNNPDKFSNGLHNLYFLQTVDKEGNVTDEKFGINILTNAGFEAYYNKYSGSSGSNIYVYIGDGSGTPSLTDAGLFNQTITVYGTEIDDTHVWNPMMYNATTGVITGMRKFGKYSWDYDIDGITENVPITEIGISTANKAASITQSNLMIHALVYDKDGNPGNIVKKPTEKLFISIYWTANMDESIITTAWNDGVYICIDPYDFINMKCNSTEGRYYANAYSSGKSLTDRVNCRFAQYINDNVMLYSITENTDEHVFKYSSGESEVYTSKTSYLDSFILSTYNKAYWYSYHGNGISREEWHPQTNSFILNYEELTEPEELTSFPMYTNLFSPIFRRCFGTCNYDSDLKNAILPVSGFKITDLKAYNHVTESWDISTDYVDGESVDYRNPFFVSGKVCVNLNGTATIVRVLINTHANRFNLTGLSSTDTSGFIMYLTDKYWDPSTYENVIDVANIPSALQNKKYIVSTTFQESASSYELGNRNAIIHPIYNYGNSAHQLLNVPAVIDTGKTINLYAYESYYPGDEGNKTYVNDTDGWVLMGQKLLYPFETGCPTFTIISPYGETLSTTSWVREYESNIMRWVMNDGKTIIARTGYDSAKAYYKKCRVYDLTNTPANEPTYYDFDLTVDSDTETNIFCWSTNSGYFVASRTSTYKVNIMNINNVTEEHTIPQTVIENAKFATIVEQTENFIYNDMAQTETNTFVVKKLSDLTTIKTFTIPSSMTVTGLRAWKNLAIIAATSSGTYYCITYDMDTDTLTSNADMNLSNLTLTYNNLKNFREEYNDEFCLIAGNVTNSSILPCDYLFNESTYNRTPKIFEDHSSFRTQFKYVNNNRQLLWFDYSRGNKGNGWYTNAIDILDMGYLLDTDTSHETQGFGRLNSYMANKYKCIVLIRDYILFVTSNTSSIKLYPYQYFIPYKMTGTTKTIQFYNNPKKIYGKEIKIRLTNNMSKI